jgi:hypothetical protein
MSFTVKFVDCRILDCDGRIDLSSVAVSFPKSFKRREEDELNATSTKDSEDAAAFKLNMTVSFANPMARLFPLM